MRQYAPVLVAAFSALMPLGTFTDFPAPSQLPTKAHVQAQFRGMSVPFIPNQGQMDKRVAFYAATFVGTVFVTQDGSLVTSLPGSGNGDQMKPGWVLMEKPATQSILYPHGSEQAATRVSIFHGRDAKKWQTRLATYNQVAMGQPWPGISLSYSAHGNSVERLFTLAPGIAPDAIQMQLSGAKSLVLKDGALTAKTGLGSVTLSEPRAYQVDAKGIFQPVTVAYVVHKQCYGFKLGSHDTNRPVVIDPIVQATYLGGSTYDYIAAMALDSAGNVYVAGYTASTDFPKTSGGVQSVYDMTSGTEAFIAEFSNDLKVLKQTTYVGDDDKAYTLAVSPGGVWVAGFTHSINLPLSQSVSAAQATCGDSVGGTSCASGDGFVAKLSTDLTQLLGATYLGGSGDDQINTSIVDGLSGNVYVAGYTYSTDFPSTTTASGGNSDGAQQALGGAADAFVTELTGDLSRVIQSTYIGGASVDVINGIALGASDQVYVGGYTNSISFPATTFALGGSQTAAQQTLDGGGPDAFVAELTGDLTQLKQSTYLGGSQSDVGDGIAVGSAGQVYIVGYTYSADFPRTTNGAQSACGAACATTGNAFVTELSGDLTEIEQSTYLGGSGTAGVGDSATALALGAADEVFVTGQTASADFPNTTGGSQPTCGGMVGGTTCPGSDAFVAELSGDLQSMYQNTYLGGSNFDSANTIGMNPVTRGIYIAGYTNSGDFPETAGGAQFSNTDRNGTVFNYSGFVAQIKDQAVLNLVLSAPATANMGEAVAYDVSATNNDSHEPATTVKVEIILPSGVNYGSASASQGSCSQTGAMVTCNLGSLAPSGGKAVATINAAAATAGIAIASAMLSADQAAASGSATQASVSTTISSFKGGSSSDSGRGSRGSGGGALDLLTLLSLLGLTARAMVGADRRQLKHLRIPNRGV